MAEPNKSKKYPIINNAAKPNKLMGQNFLRDKNVLNKIIATANLTKDDCVLEVGPGLGVLTRELAKYAGQVIAVEKDKNLAIQLKEEFKNNKNAEIIEDDILEFLKTSAQDGSASGGKNYKLQTTYKVVANIPYYLTSHLIRLLLESKTPPTEIILLIQKEVAKRICARPPEMSLLAVSVQFYADVKIIASVSKKAFRPQPKVDSAIIRITPHAICHPERSEGSKKDSSRLAEARAKRAAAPQNDKINIENFFRVVRAGFSHPRKQLLGNLSGGLKMEKEKIISALQAANLSPQQRAETLTVNDWLNVAELLKP